jgi:hydroxymethylbilane synthase
LLRAAEPSVEVELVTVETHADRRLDLPIWELGGKGAFAKEVQAALLDGRADLAVHSAKDLPSVTPPGLVIAAVPERGDPRDALVGATVDGLPDGGVVATGSLRRKAQLAHLRPDLRFVGLRGNMQTRLAKAADVDAIVVAAIAFDRLGLDGHIAQRLATAVMLPQVAQGALAVECRSGDDGVRALVARVEHAGSRGTVDAERGFLVELGGDCSLPAAAHATIVGGDADAGQVRVEGLLATEDGSILVRHTVTGPVADGPALGRSLARHLLDDQDGAKLLDRT